MLSRGLRLGRIFGIEIAFDYSWLFIVVLMTWSLAAAFAQWHADWTFTLSVVVALVASLLFFASVVVHELAHALVARRFGVPVRNITLFLFGGVSNLEREPPSPKAEFLTAVVGPLTSIVLGVVLVVIGALATRVSSDAVFDPAQGLGLLSPAETLLMWLGPINILVAIFNLIPGFPLDGGRILRSAIWAVTRDLHVATRWASAFGQGIGWAFVLLGIALAFGAYVPFFGRGLASGLWLAFVGWFLAMAASQTWRRQLVMEVLEGQTVARLMRPARNAVRAEVDLATLVNDFLLHSEDRAFPVVDAVGHLVGLITLADVRRTPRALWATTRVEQAMTPAPRLVITSPDEGLAEALEKLVRADISQLPVLDGDRLVGMLHRTDIARWIELHMQVPGARGLTPTRT